jgi:hypothetical protein
MRCATSQKIVLFIVTALKPSNPAQFSQFFTLVSSSQLGNGNPPIVYAEEPNLIDFVLLSGLTVSS